MDQEYTKNSFDRYGDDLCELILSYLSFDDKIRYECVSTQFSRSVYQKQYELTIDEKVFTKLKKTDTLGNEWTDIKLFKVFAKKLTSLKTVSISYNTFWCKFSKFLQMIEIILKYCQYLSEIHINFIHITDEKANKFFRKFGPKLTKIVFSSMDNLSFDKTFCINNLANCTSLKELNIMNIERIFHGKNNCLVKTLKKFTFIYLNWDTDSFEQFIECNKNTLECIEVYFPRFIQPVPLGIFMQQLTKLKQLRQLRMTFLDFYTFSIVNYLVEISEMCPKLQDLYLLYFSETIDSNIDLFNSMKNFKNLRKLHLNLYTGFIPDEQVQFTSQALRGCPRLTHLSFRANVNSITNLFFENIGRHAPNLRYLNVWDANISGVALEAISYLGNLKKLHLASTVPKQVFEDRVYDLLELCPNLEVIDLENFETLDYKEVKSILKPKKSKPIKKYMILI